jgi:hypothetical protein
MREFFSPFNTNPGDVLVKRISYFLVLTFVVLLIAGCGNDAPVASRDKSPAVKLNMPDEFDTFAGKCDGSGHYVVETQNHDGQSSGIAMIADKRCQGHVGPLSTVADTTP